MPVHTFVDRRQTIYLQPSPDGESGFFFEFGHKKHTLPSIKAVHDFFLAKQMEGCPFDTIKIKTGEASYHLHFSGESRRIEKRSELRALLSQKSHGAWIEEEQDGQRRYFVKEKGWFWSEIKEYSQKEFYQDRPEGSLVRKIIALALSAIVLNSSVSNNSRSHEAAFALMALQNANPSLRCLGLASFANHAYAQSTPIPTPTPSNPSPSAFQINNYTLDNQINPKVISLSDGSFLTSWSSEGQDGNGYGVFARRYDRYRRPGSEYRVNTNTTGDQNYPNQAELDNGSVIFVWSSDGQDGSSGGVYGRVFDSFDNPIGEEFRINSNTTDDQSFPVVRTLPNRRFRVVWQSMNQDGSGYGIFGKTFDFNRTVVTPERQINTYTSNNQMAPDMAVLNNGNYVVTWMSQGQDGDGSGIIARMFDADDNPIGGEYQVNNYTVSHQSYPQIAPLPNGFVITWSSYNQLGQVDEICGRVFDDNGTPGQEFVVNAFTAGDQYYQTVASLNEGFVITWQDNVQEGNGWGIYGRRFSLNGTANGTDFHVNTYVINNQMQPCVAHIPDGFIVLWQSGSFTFGAEFEDGSYFGIFGQMFDYNANRIGPTTSGTSTFLTTAGSFSNISTVILNSMTSTSTSAAMGSIAPSAFSGSSNLNSIASEPATLTSAPSSSSAFSSAISPVTTNELSHVYVINEITYGTSYVIFINGEEVGTFVVSGGSGMFSQSNQNSLVVTLNADALDGLDERVFTLFTAAADLGAFDSLTLESTSTCLNLHGNTTQGNDGQIVYQVIYSGTSCTSASMKQSPQLTLK